MKDFFVTPEDGKILVRLAREAIEKGLKGQRPDGRGNFRGRLGEEAASFVTLQREGGLRGCIGSLLAYRPLALDVMENAYNAAFRDPRFRPLEAGELEGLSVKVSVLTPPEPMGFVSEADLLAQLRPGVDGLILSDGLRQATFLPSVWEQLPDSATFLAHLKAKAGLPARGCSPTLRAARYRTEEFS